MKLFIPSKNRACQLHLLCESLARNCSKIDWKVDVLFRATSVEYERGYSMLAKRFTNVRLVEETNFAKNFKDFLLDNVNYFICLGTDDCIFYRPFQYTEGEILERLNNDVWNFSFRLGYNTVIQDYTINSKQPCLLEGPGYLTDGPFIKWEWKKRGLHLNYGYPVSWDFHIYRSADLLDLYPHANASNPRHFEGSLVNEKLFNLIKRDWFVSDMDSHVVCNTNNCVQDPPLAAGTKFPFSAENLNKKYLEGNIIDIEKFDFSNVVSCHEEYDICFKKYVNSN